MWDLEGPVLLKNGAILTTRLRIKRPGILSWLCHQLATSRTLLFSACCPHLFKQRSLSGWFSEIVLLALMFCDWSYEVRRVILAQLLDLAHWYLWALREFALCKWRCEISGQRMSCLSEEGRSELFFWGWLPREPSLWPATTRNSLVESGEQITKTSSTFRFHFPPLHPHSPQLAASFIQFLC